MLKLFNADLFLNLNVGYLKLILKRVGVIPWIFLCFFIAFVSSSFFGNWWGLRFDDSLIALRVSGSFFLAIVFTSIVIYLKNISKYHKLIFLGSIFYYIVILFATWPGYLMTDSRAAVMYGLNVPIHTWLGFFTPFFYSSIINVFPHVGAIVATQLLLMATVMIFCIRIIDNLTKTKVAGVLFLLIMLFKPSFVYNSLLLSRDTLFAIISLWACALVVGQYIYRQERILDLFSIGFFSALLPVIRGDGIFVLIPLSLILFFLFRKNTSRFFYICTVVVVLFSFLVFLPKKIGADNPDLSYKLVNIVNPLGYVLQSKYHVDPHNRLNSISKVVDVDSIIMLQHPYETPAFWEGRLMREGLEDKEISLFFKNAIMIILDNLPIYFAGRAELFFASVGFSERTFRHIDYYAGWNPNWGAPSKMGLNDDLKRPVPKLFEFIDNILLKSSKYYGFKLKGSVLFWNVIPSLIVLILVVGIWSLAPVLAMASSVVLIRVPLVFLTAPASQYKYYFSIDVCGIFIFSIIFGILLKRWFFRGEKYKIQNTKYIIQNRK